MKKALLSMFAITCASVISAAQVNWSAYNFTENTNISGTAYLIQYTGEGPLSSQTIADALVENGTTYNGEDFTLLGTTTELVDQYGVGFEGTQITGLNISSADGFFTLVIDSEGNFYLSDILNGVTNIETTPGSGEYQYFLEFYNYTVEDNYQWYTGKVGSGDVPEPTALALLALGVAGVALRRRVR